METESIIILVVLVVVALLVCLRRRRKRGVVVAGQEVKEEFTSSTTVYTETAHRNSVVKLFKGDDIDAIVEKVSSLDDVSSIVRRAGLESCNLIFGIDYTGSNYMQGKKTFGGKCLHKIDPDEQNPYQKVIAVLGETLEPFDDDGSIPTYGFGDTFTRDHSVFSLNSMAIEIVKKSKSVTAERATIDAIVDASNYPLSIIMVGVGDGPWDTMKDFDDKLPKRRFDNFHFVNFSAVTEGTKNPQAAFAMHALKEIPDQYKAIRDLGLLDM
nr:hypothetical protein BaRGS_021498 [Batillaria attramentaria]